MKIYPYLSSCRGINETDVTYVETCNLQKVWDSFDSLNGNNCLPYLIFIPHDLQFGEGKRRNEFAEWHVAWLAE